MDLYVAFGSMFLLAFGIAAIGLGIFTTYFGAGKSRAIGVILSLIGVVVLLIFYLMTIDYFGYGWVEDDVQDSFLGVIGMLIGVALSVGLVIGLMIIIKEDEPEVPGIKDWESDLETEESAEEKSGEMIGDTDDITPLDDAESKESESEAVDEDESKAEEFPGEEPEEPTGDKEPEDDMSEFLKDKEEKKIVKEEWEKVDEDGKEIPAPDEEVEPSAPEEFSEKVPPAPEEFPEEEPPVPEDLPEDEHPVPEDSREGIPDSPEEENEEEDAVKREGD